MQIKYPCIIPFFLHFNRASLILISWRGGASQTNQCIKQFGRRVRETVSAKGERERVAAKIMKASIFLLVLASASAAPQFEGLKNIFSALSGNDEPGEVNGDYEQVPYTTLKKFDVSFSGCTYLRTK